MYDVNLMGTILEEKDFLTKENVCVLTGKRGGSPSRGIPLATYPDEMLCKELLGLLREKIGMTTRLKLSAVWPAKSRLFRSPDNKREAINPPPTAPHLMLRDCLSAF